MEDETNKAPESKIQVSLRRMEYAVNGSIALSGGALFLGLFAYLVGLAAGTAYVKADLGGLLLVAAYVFILVALHYMRKAIRVLAARVVAE